MLRERTGGGMSVIGEIAEFCDQYKTHSCLTYGMGSNCCMDCKLAVLSAGPNRPSWNTSFTYCCTGKACCCGLKM